MDLWNALQQTHADYSSAWHVALIGGAIALTFAFVGTVLHVGQLLKRLAVGPFMVAAAVAAVTLIWGNWAANTADDVAYEQRSDLIADYLLAEHDLVALDPIHFRADCFVFSACYADRTGAKAWTTAVASDGSVVAVDINWLDFSSRPHDPDAKLPPAFEPITVTQTVTQTLTKTP